MDKSNGEVTSQLLFDVRIKSLNQPSGRLTEAIFANFCVDT